MKKILLVAAMAVATLSANAQVYVGGSLGFKSAKAVDGADNVSEFNIAPEVGYVFNEQWAAGVALGYTSKNGNANSDIVSSTTTKWTNSDAVFTLNPYARYTFCKSGIASFFLDGGLDFAFYNNSRGATMGIAFRPGVKLSASEKVDFVAHVGYLGYKFGNDDFGKGNFLGLGVDNSISFGVYYNF